MLFVTFCIFDVNFFQFCSARGYNIRQNNKYNFKINLIKLLVYNFKKLINISLGNKYIVDVRGKFYLT